MDRLKLENNLNDVYPQINNLENIIKENVNNPIFPITDYIYSVISSVKYVGI